MKTVEMKFLNEWFKRMEVSHSSCNFQCEFDGLSLVNNNSYCKKYFKVTRYKKKKRKHKQSKCQINKINGTEF